MKKSEIALHSARQAIAESERLLDASNEILGRSHRYSECAPEEIRYKVIRECGLHDTAGGPLRTGDVICRSLIAESDRIAEMVQSGKLRQDDYRLPQLSPVDHPDTWLA